MPVTKPLPPNPLLRGLYAITPDMSDTETLCSAVSSVLSGGCRVLQYRDKISSASEKPRRAAKLQTMCVNAGAVLIINDDWDLALTVNAHGVHLGCGDGDIRAARKALGAEAIIGASCYGDLALAAQAVDDGASYIAFGAVFSSSTKPDAVHVPLSLIDQARALFSMPICAIGGITLANAPSVIEAGADMVAVITDLFSAPDIAVQATHFQHLFQENPS
jgi:thiamine-phosphate pyrophosphorylase